MNELSTNKDETIAKLRKALVEAAIPLEALNLNGMGRFSGEMREGILSAIRTIRATLTSTEKEG